MRIDLYVFQSIEEVIFIKLIKLSNGRADFSPAKNLHISCTR